MKTIIGRQWWRNQWNQRSKVALYMPKALALKPFSAHNRQLERLDFWPAKLCSRWRWGRTTRCKVVCRFRLQRHWKWVLGRCMPRGSEPTRIQHSLFEKHFQDMALPTLFRKRRYSPQNLVPTQRRPAVTALEAVAGPSYWKALYAESATRSFSKIDQHVFNNCFTKRGKSEFHCLASYKLCYNKTST